MCVKCKGSHVKRNGKTKQGKQRWYCLDCRQSYLWRNPTNQRVQKRIWFERWMREGYGLRQLSQQSGHSISTLWRWIDYWLTHPPRQDGSLQRHVYLIFDGTYLPEDQGMFAVMEAQRHEVLCGSFRVQERPPELQRFCQQLHQRGLYPKSATVDGNPHVQRMLLRQWPHLLLQRCLVHIQRQGLSWCREHPKRTDAKHLRKIFLQVMNIKTALQRDHFLQQVEQWEQRFGTRIASSAESGWVFSDLKRARSMLLAALPNMFHYLQDPLIPKTNNALEGYFARLKHRYYQHRGLSSKHQEGYFQWYLYLCPR